MLKKMQIQMANQYFDRRMKKVLVDRVSAKGVETFEKYLAYRYRDNCYYYSGYAIMGMNDDDYLMRGELYGYRAYSDGWVEFKYRNQEYVFDSMCRSVVPKDEWYEEFKPNVKFKHSKKEIVESIMNDNVKSLGDNCFEIQNVGIKDYYMEYVYRHGILCMHGDKVKKFIAYDEPSG